MVNELVTNAIKHVGPPCRIVVRAEADDSLSLSVSDTGKGPSENGRPGMGSRILGAFATQLSAGIETNLCSGGYSVVVTIPLPKSSENEGADSRG